MHFLRFLAINQTVFQKSIFWMFLIEEIDIFQMFLVQWKNIFLSEVITGQMLAPMCNYIVRDFQSPVLKTEFKNLSPPTVFEQSHSNFQDMF